MPSSWTYWSTVAVGYVAPQNNENQHYVALYKIQYHLNQGYNEAEVALIWNQGNASACKSGVNSHGVPFNSCAYQQKILAHL